MIGLFQVEASKLNATNVTQNWPFKDAYFIWEESVQ